MVSQNVIIRFDMTKENIKSKAISLRKDGYSYSYISGITGVSKSTLSDWLHDMEYKPNKYTKETIGKARTAGILAQRLKKQKSIKVARDLAVEDIKKLSKRDLFMLGIGLYIGEGSKTANSVRLSNSDPRIIKTAINWFIKACDLQKTNFSIRMHLYPDSSEQESLEYWSKTTGLPKSSFLPTYVDVRVGKKRVNDGKLPYGTVHLSVRGKGVGFFRRIMAWIDLVHEKAGIV